MKEISFRQMAASLQKQIPHFYDSLLIVAAASPLAQQLAGGEAPTRSEFREAVGAYLSKLPEDLDKANEIIARDARKVLDLPEVDVDQERLVAAKEALAEAQAQIESIEAGRVQRIQRNDELEKLIQEKVQELIVWERDWDAITLSAKETISRNYGIPLEKSSPYDRSLEDAAFNDLQRVPILKSLAPQVIEKIKIAIAEAEIELQALKPTASEPAPAPFRGKVKLATA